MEYLFIRVAIAKQGMICRKYIVGMTNQITEFELIFTVKRGGVQEHTVRFKNISQTVMSNNSCVRLRTHSPPS